MNSFEDIVLFDNKALRRAELHHLEKVNVICGANNSGKTTLLECLTDKRKFGCGLRAGDVDVKSVEASYLGNARWNDPRYSDKFHRSVASGFAARECWYSTEIELLKQAIIKAAERFQFGIQHPHDLTRALSSQFPGLPNVVFVSAKRRLEAQVEVNSGQSITGSGDGVLNALFAAKNSPPTQAHRQSFDAISRAFSAITGGWVFDVFIGEKNMLGLKFFKPEGGWLAAEDCGLGFRELLVILYFSFAGEFSVIVVEEPENHLHPDLQRKLITYLKQNAERQFFLSTHSSVFSNTLHADRVFICKAEKGITVENVTSRAELLSSLGYSVADNLLSDLVILVEGPSDKVVVEEFLRKLGIFEKHTIRIWPLGGDIMAQLDLSVFSDAYRVMALLDKDPKSARVRQAFVDHCTEKKVPVHRLQRYAMENYFSLRVIEAVMHQKAPDGLTELKPDVRVADQLGFDVKRNAGAIATAMSLDDIAGTDLLNFLNQVGSALG